MCTAMYGGRGAGEAWRAVAQQRLSKLSERRPSMSNKLMKACVLFLNIYSIHSDATPPPQRSSYFHDFHGLATRSWRLAQTCFQNDGGLEFTPDISRAVTHKPHISLNWRIGKS